MKKQKVNETLRKATNEKKQVRVNESTLIKATATYKRKKALESDVSKNSIVEEILLKYIKDNKWHHM